MSDDPKLVAEAQRQTPGQLRARLKILGAAIRAADPNSAVFWRLNQQCAALERVLHEKETANA